MRIPRLPWDAHFMLHAHLAATRATCDRGPELLFDPGRHGVGAVIVRSNRIVAGGYNGSPPGQPHCDGYRCSICELPWTSRGKECGRYVKEDFDGRFVECTSEFEMMAHATRCLGKRVGGHVMRNGSCVRTLHAEENALLQCALDGVSPTASTVYTTASPCYDCSKRLIRVGVSRVVHAAEYGSRYGLSEDAVEMLRSSGIAVDHLDVREFLR